MLNVTQTDSQCDVATDSDLCKSVEPVWVQLITVVMFDSNVLLYAIASTDIRFRSLDPLALNIGIM